MELQFWSVAVFGILVVALLASVSHSYPSAPASSRSPTRGGPLSSGRERGRHCDTPNAATIANHASFF